MWSVWSGLFHDFCGSTDLCVSVVRAGLHATALLMQLVLLPAAPCNNYRKTRAVAAMHTAVIRLPALANVCTGRRVADIPPSTQSAILGLQSCKDPQLSLVRSE